VRFACVGLTVACFFAGLNALFGRKFGLSPELAFFIAYPPALALHFLLNKIWTFGDRTSTTHNQLGEYLFSVAVTFLIQWPSFLFFQEWMGLRGWFAALLANLLQMSASFALLRWRVFHGASGAPKVAASNPWHRIAILFTVIGGTALIYWTAMDAWVAPHFAREERDYYNLLVSGFRKGSLAMDVAVPEALKRAENPWDPGKRPPGIALHDASYFNGHYYLYFGVVPAILLFWPFHALTGFDLPFALATVFYVTGAFLLSVWLWLRVIRERFLRASLLTKISGPIVFGLCAGQLALARRSSIWEMPIAAGHFFMVCFVASSYLALRSKRPWVALSLAGLSVGLAIGSRPTLAAAGPALAFLVIACGLAVADGRSRLWTLTKSLLSAGIPFAAIVAGLLAYNWRRFGKPLEFGLNYQLTSVYEAKAHHFLVRFAPFNLGAYFLEPPQWGRYFPFIHPQSWVAQPEGYYGMEFVYGALVVCPAIFGAALSICVLLRRRGTPESAMVFLLLLAAVATTLVLACFNTAAARYTVDFLPWWLWIAMFGWAWLESELCERWPTHRVAGALCAAAYGACVASTVLMAFVQSVALHGVFANRNPAAYNRLSRILDYPASIWEGFSHQESGPMTMDVVFPEFHGTVLEPLLVTGVGYESDYFFVYYKASGIVRLGYANSGDAPIYSSDVHVKPGVTYRIRFEGGALYPPEGHPVFARWTDEQVHEAKTWLRMDVDGQAAVHQPVRFQDGAPEFLQVGGDIRSAAFGKRFSGSISNVRRERLVAAPEMAASSGDFVMEVTLPDEVVPGSQPLVVAGPTGSAELVGYRTIDGTHFVLSYEKWGGGYWESDPIAVPANREATFRIRLGSLLPRTGPFPQGLFNDLLVVWMNGQPVWWRQAFGELGRDPRVEVMVNSIGSSAMRNSFQGNLLSLKREAIPDVRTGSFDSLELDLAGKGSGTEPLAVTGIAGRADLLAIEWLPDNKARLLLDHWSHAGFSSRSFSWDPAKMHHLRLTLPSFSALGSSATASGTGMLKAEVDGAVVWEERVPFYGAAAESFAFGKNTVGSSIALPSNECRLGDIRQVVGKN
jgi:putative flippase GtrA